MSKITYWKCVDCGSMINDENMLLNDPLNRDWDRYEENDLVEFCFGCHTYNPEVVIAYE